MKHLPTEVLNGTRQPAAGGLCLAIGIATKGRPGILAETIADLDSQTRPPDRIIVAYSEPVDIGDGRVRFPHVNFVQSELGLTRQRNTILRALRDEDVVTFLDDDFYLEKNYLAIVEQVFSWGPRIAIVTGKILADGINGPGLTLPEAHTILAAAPDCLPGHALVTPPLTPAFNAYGCNMSIRVEPVRHQRLQFDESLPLYGWYEDVDFSRQVAPFGDIVRVENAYGVHLGSKSGRQSGFRLGYSQVANPFYLARKHSVPWSYAIASMTSRSLKNLVRSVVPEPFVDRRGRLRGNLRGWRELLSGAISPTRILDL